MRETIAFLPAFVIGLLAVMAQRGNANADAPSYTFDTANQTLTQALKTYAQTTHQQIIFTEDLVKGRKAPALKGEYTAEAALQRLLAGTGLTAERAPSGALMIKRPNAAVTTSDTHNEKETDGVNLAQADQAMQRIETDKGAGGTQNQEDQNLESNENQESRIKGTPEILVKGKKSLNMDIRRTEDSVQPYVVLDREQIEHSMATNLEDFLKTRLPMHTGQRTNSMDPASQNIGQSSINLRGLGANQTLILVNGRRMPGISNIQFTGDFNQPRRTCFP